jgi:hypothetical protein
MTTKTPADRRSREHWPTCRLAMAAWHFASACRWDGQRSQSSEAYIPHYWSWKRPMLFRWANAVADRVERAAWRVAKWHFGSAQ